LAGNTITAMPRFIHSDKSAELEFEEEVPVQTLDAYAEEHGLEVGLIKADIEGAEPAFLQGARETIIKHRPILLISIYHYPDDFFGIKPMIESWDLGYGFKIVPGSQKILSGTLLIAEAAK
jgi:hypothetical protein